MPTAQRCPSGLEWGRYDQPRDAGRMASRYLQHRITRANLVDRAEHAMLHSQFEENGFDTIRDITARLGLADVRQFGLTWEECADHFVRLGYRLKVDIIRTR